MDSLSVGRTVASGTSDVQPCETKANVIPCLRYRDALQAIEWPCMAFGFEEQRVVPGEHGTIGHAQLTFGLR